MASITATPGPVSNANAPSVWPRRGTHVTFAIPPMFSSQRPRASCPQSITSASGTRGAPPAPPPPGPGNPRGVAEREGRAPRLVPDSLSVRCDEREIFGGDASLREQAQDRAGKPLAERDVQERDVLRRAARHRVDDRASFGGAVCFLPKCHELRRVLREPHQRRRDAE